MEGRTVHGDQSAGRDSRLPRERERNHGFCGEHPGKRRLHGGRGSRARKRNHLYPTEGENSMNERFEVVYKTIHSAGLEK